MPSLADTLKSTRFPIDVDHLCRRAHFVALQAWRRKCCTSTAVPTAPSPASKSGLMALSSAFFIIRIIAGVASTCGKYGVALNRSARWSGYTRNVWRPNVLVAAGKAANLVGERRHCQLSGPRAPFFAPLGSRAGVTHASTEARSFMGGPRRSSQGRCLLLPRGIVTLSRCGLPSLVHVPYLATHIDGHLARVGHQSARGAAVRSGSEGGRRPRRVSRHRALGYPDHPSALTVAPGARLAATKACRLRAE